MSIGQSPSVDVFKRFMELVFWLLDQRMLQGLTDCLKFFEDMFLQTIPQNFIEPLF